MAKTKKEMYNEILARVSDNQEMVDFINRELELLAKRNSGERKPTEKQKENVGFKADIFAFLEEVDAPVTIDEIKANVESVSQLNPQRISPILSKLCKEGKIERTYDKRKAYFSLIH